VKSLLFLAVVSASVFIQGNAQAQDSICKAGDFRDCVRALKAKGKDTNFAQVYDQVCVENKGFKCIKITIRGEPNEELAYQKSQYPKAELFLTKVGGEDKIYVLEPRQGYKPTAAKKVTEKKSSAKKSSERSTEKMSESNSQPSQELEIADPEGPHVPLEGE
jgi:hypothetical protein